MSTTIKFNAGKVQFDEVTKKCTPLPHKGQVTINPSSTESGFYDFEWSPKSLGLSKDQLLIIPGDVTLKPVVLCKSGRVMALTFLSSGAKYLYWLQDVGDDDNLNKFTEKDNKILTSVSELLSYEESDEEK